jgi:PAS domain S-box-containing protein
MKADLLAGQETTGEVLNYSKDGTPYWIEIRISPLYNEEGTIVSFVSVQRNVTERKEREIRQEQAERLTSVGEEIANLGTWGIDLADGQVHWSRGMYKIMDRDPALGPPSNDHVLSSIAEAERQRVAALFDRSVREGRAFQTDVDYVTEKGNRRLIRMRGEAILAENGRARAIVGATRDITAEREASKTLEDAIDTNSELSRDFANARKIAKIGVFDYSVKEDLQHWSEELLEMTGLQDFPFPAPAERFISGIDKKDRPKFDRLLNEAVDNGTPYQLRILFHRPDGRDVHMQIVADVKDTANDRRIVGVARDVTDEIEASELLRKQEERFRIIANSVSDVLWDIDEQDGYRWISPDWSAKIGLGFDGTIRSPVDWMDFICDNDRERVKASVAQVLRSSSKFWKEQAMIVGGDGQEVNVEVNATLLRSDDNRVYRALGNLRNIDREVELNDLLAQTRGLESLSKMTGGIAHDFNNLMMIVLGNTELLEMADLHEADRESVGLIAQAAESASDLTTRLLQFSGTQYLNEKVVDLRLFLDGLLPLLKSSLTASREVETAVAKELFPIEVDSSALEQAILNFALNSRDAMPSGGRLSIRCENKIVSDQMLGRDVELAPGVYVCISISDDGNGMDPDVLAQATQPFFTTKERGKGTGLGLSSAYGFARQSGGGIQIYSEVGLGTTINLYLPAAKDRQVKKMNEGLVKPDPQSVAHSILVVEDEPAIRSHVERILSRAGFEVSSAEDAARALEIVSQGKSFDLLLTDVVMPGGINGVELAARMKKIAPDMKVLFTSGFLGAAFDDQAIEAAEDYPVLQKPYRSADLFEAVEQALKAGAR